MNNDTINPCKFCNQDVVYRPIDKPETNSVKIYFCYDCSAEYIYWLDFNYENYITTSIYITHHHKMYRWTTTGSIAHLWYVKTPGIPGVKKNEGLELLKTFEEDIPNITPDNFLDKLSIYLLFL